jgi:hypothetical protein
MIIAVHDPHIYYCGSGDSDASAKLCTSTFLSLTFFVNLNGARLCAGKSVIGLIV